MKTMSRSGVVLVQGRPAGKLIETDEGYEFSYDANYLKDDKALPVSMTLPLTDEVYKSKVLHPFFDGLIPEGWLLGVVERNWKIDYKDRFGLLLATCRDCIGDVAIMPEEDV